MEGKNVLIQRHSVIETARMFGKDEGEIRRLLEECLEKLWRVRLTRPKPHRDDKVITAWNGNGMLGMALFFFCFFFFG